MKKIIFLISLINYSILFSQHTRKVFTKYKFINPPFLSTIYCPGDLNLTIRLTNLGPDILTSFDSFQTYIYRRINLNTPYYDKFNFKLNKDIIVGDSIDFNIKIRLWDTTNENYYTISNSGGYFFYNSTSPILSDSGKTNNQKYSYVHYNLVYDKNVNIFSNLLYPIKIFPNPISDYIEIENSEKHISIIEFYDIYGKLFLSKGDFKENDNIIIETNEFISGIYFVKVIAENGLVFTQKVKKD